MKPSQSAPVELPPDTPLDDLVLMKKIVERDETALATLYDRWMPQVYSLAMNVLQSAVDAEDVVEETFWQVWERASTYDASFVSPLTWILSISRTRSLDRLRARRRRRGETLEAYATTLKEGERTTVVQLSKLVSSLEVDGAAEREAMSYAVQKLPIEQQRPIELAYFGGFRQNEIAEILQLPLDTVRVRSRTGMELLRNTAPALRGDTV